MSAQRLLLPLLLMVGLILGASLPQGPGSHPGVCPNQLSPNLWVDAQSTCERECVGDQVSMGFIPTHPGGGPRELGWPEGSPDPTPVPRPCLQRGPQLRKPTSSLAPTLLPGFQAVPCMRVSGDTPNLCPPYSPNLPTPTLGPVVFRTSQVEKGRSHIQISCLFSPALPPPKWPERAALLPWASVSSSVLWE